MSDLYHTPQEAIDVVMAQPEMDAVQRLAEDGSPHPDAPESHAPAESGPAAAAPSAASEQLDKLYPGAMGRMNYWEETVCQLMAMMRYCARGDADIAALKTAIRLVAKKHRDSAKWLLKKRAERGQS